MSTALQIVGTADAEAMVQLVSFRVAGEEYGVEVGRVREIIRLPEITKVPRSPAHIDGIIHLRGSVIPIISLRETFGLPPAPTDNNTRIVVTTVGERVFGFKVDAVSEVIRISLQEVQPPPFLIGSGGEKRCVEGVVNRAERLLIMLDPERIVSGADVDWEAAA